MKIPQGQQVSLGAKTHTIGYVAIWQKGDVLDVPAHTFFPEVHGQALPTT